MRSSWLYDWEQFISNSTMTIERMQQVNIMIDRWFNKFNSWSNEQLLDLYLSLCQEEEKELQQAILAWDTVAIVDAVCDVVRVWRWLVRYWRKVTWELKDQRFDCLWWEMLLWSDLFYEAMDEVIKSNYTKSKDPNYTDFYSRKVLKGPNYQPPNLLPIIEKYRIDTKQSLAIVPN